MDNSHSQQSPAEPFRTVPNPSESFGTVPNHSEEFRSLPKGSERKENHTLTVREAARSFEAAGVARTERSIINWCQLNAQGVARLDAYFDPNERKYFITPQSVEQAIAEEKAKAAKNISGSELVQPLPNAAEKPRNPPQDISEDEAAQISELQKEVVDLKIANRGKDLFIAKLQQEHDNFSIERQVYVDKLMTFSRRVGELETKLLQLSAPSEAANKVAGSDASISQ